MQIYKKLHVRGWHGVTVTILHRMVRVNRPATSTNKNVGGTLHNGDEGIPRGGEVRAREQCLSLATSTAAAVRERAT